MYDIIPNKRIWYGLSIVLMVASIVCIAIGGLQLGIDFTGGTRLVVQYPAASRPTADALRTLLEPLQLGELQIQQQEDTDLAIRLRTITEEERTSLFEKLREGNTALTEKSYETIGPIIGKELRQRAVSATILVLLGILAYISFAFRRSTHGPVRSWAYGVGAIVALLHDLLIVVGAFAFLGLVADVEVDSLFVTACLTILGFSVHDTIVVYDRVRENLKNRDHPSFAHAVNVSVNETLVRSLNTTFTTLLALLVLFLFGGESIRSFILALMIGMVIGTYSSIFIASPFLVTLHHWRSR